MILLLDNFDSFTFNLVDYLHQLNVSCDVRRNDHKIEDIISQKYSGVILSPGSGNPINAGNMMEIINYYHNKLPIMGICLGHQAIGQYFGAKLQKSLKPMHGKISEIICKAADIHLNIPEKIKVVRYHSLILSDLPSNIEAIAHSSEGEIMSIRHNTLPIYGLQYHPEAILTEYGKEILKNWVYLHKVAD